METFMFWKNNNSKTLTTYQMMKSFNWKWFNVWKRKLKRAPSCAGQVIQVSNSESNFGVTTSRGYKSTTLSETPIAISSRETNRLTINYDKLKKSNQLIKISYRKPIKQEYSSSWISNRSFKEKSHNCIMIDGMISVSDVIRRLRTISIWSGIKEYVNNLLQPWLWIPYVLNFSPFSSINLQFSNFKDSKVTYAQR